MLTLTDICPNNLTLVPPRYRPAVALFLRRLHALGYVANAAEGYEIMDQIAETRGCYDVLGMVEALTNDDIESALQRTAA